MAVRGAGVRPAGDGSGRRERESGDQACVVGAVVGGGLFTTFGSSGVGGFNLWSILVATVGATVTLMVFHMIVPRP